MNHELATWAAKQPLQQKNTLGGLISEKSRMFAIIPVHEGFFSWAPLGTHQATGVFILCTT